VPDGGFRSDAEFDLPGRCVLRRELKTLQFDR
jgi:hypothetical protein